MSKCQSCEHFEYRCGIALSLQRITGISSPTHPTCYCLFSGVNWPRYSGEIKKPRGIKCEYVIHKMQCTECEKLLKSSNDLWMKITRDTFICKKCGEKKEEKRVKK